MQFGWIDFSKQDKSNAINIINSLEEKGVLDELGFGSIRGAFADTFFPGTSTIQTRAKYLLVVPYILNDYIRSSHKIEKDFNRFFDYIQRAIDASERKTAKRMITNCKGEPQGSGIIGARSIAGNSWVERAPVSIYWNGLRTYKFFRSDNPRYSYAEFISQIYNLEKNRASSESSKNTDRDDKNDSDAGNFSKKSPLSKLPTYKKGWLKEIDIELTEEEAAFLKDKIISSVGDSVFGIIIDRNIDISKCTDFETFTKVMADKVDIEKRHQLDLANKFNEFYYIAMLRYSFKLSKGLDEGIADEWFSYAPKVETICNNLDVDDLFGTMKIQNPKLKVFMAKLKTAFLEGKIDETDELIKDREFRLKTSRAKLSMADYCADEYPLFKKFDYRFAIACRLISDMRQGTRNDKS